MRWDVTTPPSTTPITYAQLPSYMYLDNDGQRDDVLDMIGAATEFAEQSMECSLITRTITAVFYQSDCHGHQYDGQYFSFGYTNPHTLAFELPRGPLISISSVTDTNGATPTYRTERRGHAEMIVLTSQWVEPLTVVYTAGYGASATSIPADIRQGIKQHIKTMYEYRESISDKAMVPIPNSLKDFYERKSRGTVIG